LFAFCDPLIFQGEAVDFGEQMREKLKSKRSESKSKRDETPSRDKGKRSDEDDGGDDDSQHHGRNHKRRPKGSNDESASDGGKSPSHGEQSVHDLEREYRQLKRTLKQQRSDEQKPREQSSDGGKSAARVDLNALRGEQICQFLGSIISCIYSFQIVRFCSLENIVIQQHHRLHPKLPLKIRTQESTLASSM
jgi:hypothetical protein